MLNKSPFDDRSAAQRFHGERVELRQKHRAESTDAGTLLENAARSKIAPSGNTLEDIFAEAITDTLIDSFTAPGFSAFWTRKNNERKAEGADEMLYGEASKLFRGGDVPNGAITFIGKKWNGVRAIPSSPAHDLRNPLNTRQYHAQFRSVSKRDGITWHTVKDLELRPVVYNVPENALLAAREERDALVPRDNR